MFENFVIIEILKSYRNRGVEPQLYYLRDSDGKEIDLLIEENGKIYPIEKRKQQHQILRWSKILR